MLAPALQVLEAMSALGLSMGDAASLSGPCRFGVGDLSALTWLPSFVRAIQRAHPGLVLDISVEVGGVLERRLVDGELDFAVIAGRSTHRAIRSHPVGEAHFSWVAGRGELSAGKSSVRELLKRHALVTLPDGAGTARLLDDWLLEHKVSVSSRITCNSWAAVAGMLCEGAGVGFLPTGWSRWLGLVEVGARFPLRSLRYAFQWKHGDTRALILAMRGLAAETGDFSKALALRRSGASSS